jgi:isopenicillin N synthase-like dioxygenase
LGILAKVETQPHELWPQLPEFREVMTTLYLELEECLKVCLQATAIHLGYGLKEGQHTILSNLLGSGEGVMRILHYPPIDSSHSLSGAVRSAPHEDLSIMTIIPRATRPGLQVKNHRGQWIDVLVPENAAIINSGDTLSYVTNGMIPSTTHQVINPEENDFSHRYSIPFFGSLPAHTVLKILDKCKQGMPMNLLPKEMTFGEFMRKRLHEIGIAPPA